MLQVALVGTWHVHFDQYAEEISGREDCKVTALWDDDPERGGKAAEKYGCAFEGDYDALLARSDVDAIVIASATNQHTELIKKAAQAKKHIFTEKVLCFSYEEAQMLKKVIDENNIKFCISFPWRTKSEILYAKQAIATGALGDITFGRVRNAHDGAVAGWLPEHFFDEKACGGGAMMDLGTHPLYLLCYLLGCPTAVTSVFTKVTGHEVEDNAVSILEFNNVIGSAETGFVSSNDPLTLQVSGTKGTLYWGGPDTNVLMNTGDGFKTIEEPGEPLKRPTDQWVDGILNGGDIAFDIDDAVLLTKVMEKVYESYQSGKRVTIE